MTRLSVITRPTGAYSKAMRCSSSGVIMIGIYTILRGSARRVDNRDVIAASWPRMPQKATPTRFQGGELDVKEQCALRVDVSLFPFKSKSLVRLRSAAGALYGLRAVWWRNRTMNEISNPRWQSPPRSIAVPGAQPLMAQDDAVRIALIHGMSGSPLEAYFAPDPHRLHDGAGNTRPTPRCRSRAATNRDHREGFAVPARRRPPRFWPRPMAMTTR